MSAAALLASLLCWPAAVAGAAAAAPQGVVGLVPSGRAEVTTALAEGARLAFEQVRERGGPGLTLVVGRGHGPWATVSSSAVGLVTEHGALALITPPERRAAHAVAQVATRAHIPTVSTSAAASVTGTGSYWVRSVVPAAPPGATRSGPDLAPACFRLDSKRPGTKAFVRSFRRRFGHPPGAWAAAGYDAALVLAEGVRRGGTDPLALVSAMRQGPPVVGATGPILFDSRGRRRVDAAAASIR